MSEYTLSEGVTLDDAAALAELQTKQDWDQPWFKELWEGQSRDDIVRGVETLLLRHDLTMVPECDRQLKVLHNPTGEIVGYARWSILSHDIPKAGGPKASIAEQSEYHHRCLRLPNWELWLSMGPINACFLAENEPSWPYLVLRAMVIHPEHRGGEVEKLLVEDGTKAADQLNLVARAVLDVEYNKKLFEDLGWKVESSREVERFVRGPHTFTVRVLSRRPLGHAK